MIAGFFLAFMANISMGLALNTDMPVVAVVSYSMFPFLDKGDMIIVQGGDIKVNDIIIYDVPSQRYPIIHRVIAKNEDGSFQTKGDNNMGQLSFEKSVKKEQIHGKLLARVPLMGWVKIGTLQALGML